ncbi:hypothetical protein HK100_000884 [Physocladia obscura]|uniref:Uncharacterized protein n=1 Tax=Physocladia obscura TaxID=109957 RepID=A0AAD5XF96_9FUNG|nr:hypothetical protein HK100_000884 [Physocladia obscura]
MEDIRVMKEDITATPAVEAEFEVNDKPKKAVHKLTSDTKLRWSGESILDGFVRAYADYKQTSECDKYHTGGLFQICGDRYFTYNNVTSKINPTIVTDWHCDPFNDYVDRFLELFVNYPDSDWAIQARAAKTMIVVSRVFEATTTVMDMIFGATTIWAVIYPNVDSRQQRKNMVYAIVGIILTPTFCLVDGFIQNSYWGSIGVGIYNTDIQSFLYISGVAVAFVLIISWTTHWVGYALPYWKGDVYRTAGFFQVCGDCDFFYVPETDLTKPGRRYNWTCEPVEAWANRFKAVFENYTETTWCQEAGPAKTLVIARRWLEGISSALDMIFGVASIWMVNEMNVKIGQTFSW